MSLIRSGNHGCGSPKKEELHTLKLLKEAYDDKNYHECVILIMNYLGHVQHYKSHEEIVYSLLISLSYTITVGNDDFPTYIGRLIRDVKQMKE
jgi:hypothetical protein